MLTIYAFILAFIIGLIIIYFKRRGAKPIVKKELIALPKPKELTVFKERTASKPIICPECIMEKQNTPVEEGEELEAVSSILVFDSWIPYAAHIFQKHPNSTRISWAISCVKDERDKYNEAGKELPESINILLQLIKSHGADPIVDVGVPYSMSPLAEHSNGKQKIQVVDDWGERLGEIENLKKEDLVPTEVKEEPPTNSDWMENMS